MEIKKVNSKYELETKVTKGFTKEELQNEYDYYIAEKLTMEMLEIGLITTEECNKIRENNKQIFSPYLVDLLP